MANGFRNTHGDGALAQVSGVATTKDGYDLGEERVGPDGNRYRLFYNTAQTVINPGYIFARNRGSAAGENPFHVTVTTVSEAAFNAAGAVVYNTATTGAYFWGCVETMKTPISLVGVSAIAGDGAYITTKAGGKVGTASTTGSTGQAIGYCVGTSTTDTNDGEFYVSFDNKSLNNS